MKYLLVLLVIVIAVGVWRKRRRVEHLKAQRPAPRRENRLQPPQDMVACAHCGLHLPRSDALVLGASPRPEYYCSAEHRAQGPA
ncbi:PP0621 family protein [Pantoea sp. 18069]|uniref:PP0621 family protein n=1 Tax=Pantoea sp. 18069 TaxID=2681415 RepID=UPI00135992C9|nr:PP0621 family protein [Pantoea sp. 18069]